MRNKANPSYNFLYRLSLYLTRTTYIDKMRIDDPFLGGIRAVYAGVIAVCISDILEKPDKAKIAELKKRQQYLKRLGRWGNTQQKTKEEKRELYVLNTTLFELINAEREYKLAVEILTDSDGHQKWYREKLCEFADINPDVLATHARQYIGIST